MHGLEGSIPILAHFLMKIFKVFSYFFSTSTVRVRRLANIFFGITLVGSFVTAPTITQ